MVENRPVWFVIHMAQNRVEVLGHGLRPGAALSLARQYGADLSAWAADLLEQVRLVREGQLIVTTEDRAYSLVLSGAL